MCILATSVATGDYLLDKGRAVALLMIVYSTIYTMRRWTNNKS